MDKKYYIKDFSKKHLLEVGFNCVFSDEDKNYFIYRFPIIKSYKRTTIEGVILINSDSGEIILDVIDTNNNNLYTPFYIIEYGRYDTILKNINNEINKTLRKLGIKYKKR